MVGEIYLASFHGMGDKIGHTEIVVSAEFIFDVG